MDLAAIQKQVADFRASAGLEASIEARALDLALGGYPATVDETADAHADTIRGARALLGGERWP